MNTQKGGSWAEVLIVLALVAWGLWSLKHNPPSDVINTQNSVLNSVDNTNNRPTKVGAIPQGYITYEQALVQYAVTRIQLNQDCTAIPSKMSFKNNSYLMIDNRSALSRLVKVGNISTTIKPYGFKVVQLSNPVFPVTLYLSCAQSLNVATILLQK